MTSTEALRLELRRHLHSEQFGGVFAASVAAPNEHVVELCPRSDFRPPEHVEERESNARQPHPEIRRNAGLKQRGELKLPDEDGPHPAAVVHASPDEHEAALGDVLTFLHTRTGRDFSCYKRATILRRITRRMQGNGLGAEEFRPDVVFLRYWDAEDERLRSRPALQRAAVEPGNGAGSLDRVGTGGRPEEKRGCRIRLSLGQSG